MNLRNVQSLQKPPYIHGTLAHDEFNGPTGATTPGSAQALLVQAERQYDLISAGKVWMLYKRDGTAGTVIPGGHYDCTDFRVRYISLFVDVQTDIGLLFYDLPWSLRASNYFLCGLLHNLHVTRLYLGDESTMNATRISIFG